LIWKKKNKKNTKFNTEAIDDETLLSKIAQTKNGLFKKNNYVEESNRKTKNNFVMMDCNYGSSIDDQNADNFSRIENANYDINNNTNINLNEADDDNDDDNNDSYEEIDFVIKKFKNKKK
jgi:hypothetical protein